MAVSDSDQEIDRIITTAQRFAYRMGAVFVVDPAKLRDFRTALENGKRRRALSKEAAEAANH